MTNPRLACLALAFALAATACSTGARDPEDAAAPDPQVTLVQPDEPPPHSRLSEVVEEALPSVVNVKVKNLANVCTTGTPVESRGEGSGVVIDERGIILTNNHVVAGAVKVRVFFNDGRDPLEGEVIGADADRDLAVVRVRADDLEPITLGRAEELRLGDRVLAIGFPLGLGGPTVTQGIISGLNRTIEASGASGTERLVGLLQTDAAINAGNSGGALIDEAGNLVGINTAAAAPASGENVGFAIAIDEALPVIRQILNEPAEERAWLGVQLVSVETPEAALQLGLDPEVRGAAIAGLIPDGPAAEAGLAEGSVIVGIGEFDVESAEDVSEALGAMDPGDTVEVRVVTPSGETGVELRLGEFPVAIECPEG